tara:strand:+ start:359 stop:811 length:453 start_codon:yes stop_codon:yes gene_type:complete
MWELVLYIFGLTMAAILAGSLAFFSCVVAPLIFIKLDGDTAGYFVRSIFPWYYLFTASLAAISAVSLFRGYHLEASILAFISAGSICGRQILMPWINRCRDSMSADNTKAERSFKILHGISVWINVLQLIGSISVVILLGYGNYHRLLIS